MWTGEICNVHVWCNVGARLAGHPHCCSFSLIHFRAFNMQSVLIHGMVLKILKWRTFWNHVVVHIWLEKCCSQQALTFSYTVKISKQSQTKSTIISGRKGTIRYGLRGTGHIPVNSSTASRTGCYVTLDLRLQIVYSQRFR